MFACTFCRCKVRFLFNLLLFNFKELRRIFKLFIVVDRLRIVVGEIIPLELVVQKRKWVCLLNVSRFLKTWGRHCHRLGLGKSEGLMLADIDLFEPLVCFEFRSLIDGVNLGLVQHSRKHLLFFLIRIQVSVDAFPL